LSPVDGNCGATYGYCADYGLKHHTPSAWIKVGVGGERERRTERECRKNNSHLCLLCKYKSAEDFRQLSQYADMMADPNHILWKSDCCVSKDGPRQQRNCIFASASAPSSKMSTCKDPCLA